MNKTTNNQTEINQAVDHLDNPLLLPQLADLFSLLGDTSRLTILVRCLSDFINVSELTTTTGLSQPLVSHHLRLLKASRLVVAERRGRQMFYRAADHHVQHVISDMLEHLTESNDHTKQHIGGHCG